MTPEEYALRYLDVDIEEKDEYLTSTIDLRELTDYANYAYVTVVRTDDGDSERVTVVCVSYVESDVPAPEHVICRTVSDNPDA